MGKPKKRHKETAEGKSKKMEITIHIIAITISVIALIVSLVNSVYSIRYSKEEYEYKRDPKMDIAYSIKLKKEKIGEEFIAKPIIENLSIGILEKNNLKQVYIIDSKNNVINLTANDNIEGNIERIILDTVNFEKPDITKGELEYRYKFLILYRVDGDIDIEVLIAKTKPIKGDETPYFDLRHYSEIEIYGMDKSPDTEYFKGEKIIAKQYKEINQWIRENII